MKLCDIDALMKNSNISWTANIEFRLQNVFFLSSGQSFRNRNPVLWFSDMNTKWTLIFFLQYYSTIKAIQKIKYLFKSICMHANTYIQLFLK